MGGRVRALRRSLDERRKPRQLRARPARDELHRLVREERAEYEPRGPAEAPPPRRVYDSADGAHGGPDDPVLAEQREAAYGRLDGGVVPARAGMPPPRPFQPFGKRAAGGRLKPPRPA